MHTTIRRSTAGVAALSALALGGAAIAGAADQGTSRSSSSSGGRSQTMPPPPPREALSSDVAAKVEAAALEKVPGGTVLRTEAGGPYRTAYHAHIRRSDGTRAVVLVDKGFDAVAVQADRGRGPGGPGDPGGGRPRGRPGETALTGTKKQKVDAAALAKLPGATIVRTETNADSTAPYESHVRKSDGTEVEVLVSKAFEVVDVREMPGRP